MQAKLSYEQFVAALDRLKSNNPATIAKARELLKPYKVKRAVILAAGLSSRMRPATTALPKPMISIGKKRLIETQLDALIAADITDITIVRGYRGSEFDALLVKYPNLKFINSSSWNVSGAIVSASLAIDLLVNAYLIEGDLFIKNPKIIRSYEYCSSYCGISGKVRHDWNFSVTPDGRVKKLVYGDSVSAHKFVGIMFWTAKDAKQLKVDLKMILQDPVHHQRFIESVPFDEHAGDYQIYARKLHIEDVVEVDTYQELLSLQAREGRSKYSPKRSVTA